LYTSWGSQVGLFLNGRLNRPFSLQFFAFFLGIDAVLSKLTPTLEQHPDETYRFYPISQRSAFLKDKNFKTILKKEKNNKNVHKRLTASSL
jgi:hypothetical protein